MRVSEGNFSFMTGGELKDLKDYLENAKLEVASSESFTKEEFVKFIDSLFEDCPIFNEDLNNLALLKYNKKAEE